LRGKNDRQRGQPGCGPTKQADFDPTLKRLRILIAAGLACGLALCWRLWISSRLFPLSPVNGSLRPIPFPLDYLSAALLFILLAAIIAAPRPKWFLTVFLVFAGLLSLWDQLRWQPWFYQYFFMLAAIAFYAWWKPDPKNGAAALNACRLIVVSTYFWGGLQKLNVTFLRQTWPDMSGSILRLLPVFARSSDVFALAVPFVEVAVAVGLVIARTRRLAVILAIGTHAVILIVLIVSGENTAVWPWNIALILVVWILFGEYPETAIFNPFPRTIPETMVFLLFGLLPALSFADAWDSYLSAALYSGNIDQAVIYLSPRAIQRLPSQIRPHVWQGRAPYFLDINRWAFGELNVPVYPEPRVFRNVAENVCTYLREDESDARLRILMKPNPFTGIRHSEYYDCNHLRNQ